MPSLLLLSLLPTGRATLAAVAHLIAAVADGDAAYLWYFDMIVSLCNGDLQAREPEGNDSL